MSGSDYVPSPLLHQPAFRLPGGKNVTVWIGLHVEYWSLQPPAGSFVVKGIHGNWPDHFPDFRTHSFREYGNRVGIFRIFDVLARLGLPVSIIVNADAIRRGPRSAKRSRAIVPPSAGRPSDGWARKEENRRGRCRCSPPKASNSFSTGRTTTRLISMRRRHRSSRSPINGNSTTWTCCGPATSPFRSIPGSCARRTRGWRRHVQRPPGFWACTFIPGCSASRHASAISKRPSTAFASMRMPTSGRSARSLPPRMLNWLRRERRRRPFLPAGARPAPTRPS